MVASHRGGNPACVDLPLFTLFAEPARRFRTKIDGSTAVIGEACFISLTHTRASSDGSDITAAARLASWLSVQVCLAKSAASVGLRGRERVRIKLVRHMPVREYPAPRQGSRHQISVRKTADSDREVQVLLVVPGNWSGAIGEWASRDCSSSHILGQSHRPVKVVLHPQADAEFLLAQQRYTDATTPLGPSRLR